MQDRINLMVLTHILTHRTCIWENSTGNFHSAGQQFSGSHPIHSKFRATNVFHIFVQGSTGNHNTSITPIMKEQELCSHARTNHNPLLKNIPIMKWSYKRQLGCSTVEAESKKTQTIYTNGCPRKCASTTKLCCPYRTPSRCQAFLEDTEPLKVSRARIMRQSNYNYQ